MHAYCAKKILSSDKWECEECSKVVHSEEYQNSQKPKRQSTFLEQKSNRVTLNSQTNLTSVVPKIGAIGFNSERLTEKAILLRQRSEQEADSSKEEGENGRPID